METELFKEDNILVCTPKGSKIDAFSIFAYISKNGTLYRANGFGNVMYACISRDSKLASTFRDVVKTNYRLATPEEVGMIKAGSKLYNIIKEDGG